MKTYKFKLFIAAVIVDFLLYLFLFHSGIILPFINSSLDNYNAATPFPRDFGQTMIWFILHIPTVLLFPTENYCWISIMQTGLISLGIGDVIDRKLKIKNKQGGIEE